MNMTDEQREANEYLLDQMRKCGLFKCTDCLYALWEDHDFGMEYKCCHPRTSLHSSWNELHIAMRGSACDVFEPSGTACKHAAGRMSETSDAVRRLIDYAWSKTKITSTHDTRDETLMFGIVEAIKKQGMVRV